MKTFMLAAVAGVVLMQAMPALAQEERVQHYEAVVPHSEQEARDELKAKTAEIAAVLEKKTLDDNDLEKVHEITYSLEAAVDALRKTVKGDAVTTLDTVDEAVQAVHSSSENHKEAEVREWFAKLQASVAALIS